MSMTVAGTPNLVNLLPVSQKTAPAGFTVVPASASAVTVLGDGNDLTYVRQTAASSYFRFKVGTTSLPAGARVVYARAVCRASRSGVTNRDWLCSLGDSAGKNGAEADNAPTIHDALTGVVRQITAPARAVLSNGKPIDQAAISAGLYVVFGMNTSGKAPANAQGTSSALVELSYDTAPTATVTGPSGVVNDSASPLVAWDYADDLQPQAKYQVKIIDGSAVTVYDSGLVASGDTFHQVTAHLADGTYTASVLVYQAWGGPGGDFPALAPATSAFTLATLPPPIPNVHQTKTPLSLNLLAGDDTTFAASPGAWALAVASGSYAPDPTVRYAGQNSLHVTYSVSGGHLTYRRNLDTADLAACPVKFTGHVRARLSDPSVVIQAYCTVNYYNAADQLMGRSELVPFQITNSDTWQDVVVSSQVFPPLAATYFTVDFTLVNQAGVVVDFYLAAPCLTFDDGTDMPTVPNPSTAAVSVTSYASSDVNLLGYDDSSFDNGGGSWQSLTNLTLGSTASPVRDGTHAGVATLTAASGSIGLNDGYWWVDGTKFQWTPGAFIHVRAKNTGHTQTAQLVIRAEEWIAASSTWVRTDYAGPVTTLVPGAYVPIPVTAPHSNFGQGPFLTLLLKLSGNSGDVFYLDDAYLGTDAGVQRAWSRGGLVYDGLNLLSYADSVMADPNNWVANNVNSTVSVDAGHALYGPTSLLATRITASGDIDAHLGNGIVLPIDPAQRYAITAAIYSPTVARTFRIYVFGYDAGFNQIGSASFAVTSIIGKWTPLILSMNPASTFPTSKYLSISLYVVGAAVNESHYFDGAAIAKFPDSTPLGWRPGLPPDSDIAPTVLLEKSDGDYTVFRPVGAVALLDEDGRYRPVAVFPDYEIKSGKARTYRASLTETVNGIYLQSAYSDPQVQTVTLAQVWMHARGDVAGTLAHFLYDGAGRTSQRGAQSQATVVEGREFPFAEFSTQSTGQVAVTLQLASAADQVALDALAASRAEVVFRDQRGRGASGTMGQVSYQDTSFGTVATFTLALSGDQP